MGKSGSKQQEVFKLTITKDNIESTDGRFKKDDLRLGEKYKVKGNAYFINANGDRTERTFVKHERRENAQVLPRLACQVFEDELSGLSDEEKRDFPVCQYTSNGPIIRGIFTGEDKFKNGRKGTKHVIYDCVKRSDKFVFRCDSTPFSTVRFVQECLNRWGKTGDRFILTYREKSGNNPEAAGTEADAEDGPDQQIEYQIEYSSMVIASKNLIFRGAPGTGKTYLARQVAADIVSDGVCDDYEKLDDTQKERIGFVQFHPSYDYTDFVEGLRPKANGDGTLGFELKDGVFKEFVARARDNYYEDSNDSAGKTGTKEQKYVFIIDEINRGEISKIFGELFFSVDPGYRGKKGEISTQYSNIHEDPDEKFYIPDNVYIIGTMNDVDRSVDSFDFAMRRRFRFVELKAADQTGMLDPLKEKKEEAVKRMNNLNKKIAETEGLNENYQIGPAYFLKLKDIGFAELWDDHLKPLLQEYVRGMPDEKELMEGFKKAYACTEPDHGDADGTQD